MLVEHAVLAIIITLIILPAIIFELIILPYKPHCALCDKNCRYIVLNTIINVLMANIKKSVKSAQSFGCSVN